MSDRSRVYEIGLRTRFRGIMSRQGMLFRGPAGWAEWSPFLDYGPDETSAWWECAVECATREFPAPVRQAVPVNSIIPALAPAAAFQIAQAAGCGTAKVKVAEPGQTIEDDLARVEAVRAALGPNGRIRVDANGAWGVDQAEHHLKLLARFGLEYAEQPCAQVEELAELRLRLARAGVPVLIAADESIRRSGDPERVARLRAADVAVLKVQPLGGVRRCLDLAERLGMPVVVSSALETSVGIRAGLALAAALPELPFACGLNTVPLLTGDVVADPLVALNGLMQVRDVQVEPALLDRWQAPPPVVDFWQRRRLGPPARLSPA